MAVAFSACMHSIAYLAVTIAILVNLAWSAMAVPTAGNKPAPASTQTLSLKFPTTVSCGKIWQARDDWSPLGDYSDAFGNEAKFYKPLGDARGEVKLSSGGIYKFRPSADVLQQPALLSGVPLQAFRFLDVSGADFDDNTLKVIALFPNVRRLECAMADLNDEVVGKMKVSQTLESLLLSSTPMTGLTLENFATLKNLKSLSLASVYLKPSAYRQLAAFKNLTRLDLSKTNIRDSELSLIIHSMPNLKLLALKGCSKLTAASGATLAKAPNIYMLDVIGTAITAKDIREAEGKHKITSLYSVSSGPNFTVREADKIFHPLR